MSKIISVAHVSASIMLMMVIILLNNQIGFADELTSKRAMTIDDDLKVVKVGDVLISPDVEMVCYYRESLYWTENKFVKRFCMFPFTEAPSQR